MRIDFLNRASSKQKLIIMIAVFAFILFVIFGLQPLGMHKSGIVEKVKLGAFITAVYMGILLIFLFLIPKIIKPKVRIKNDLIFNSLIISFLLLGVISVATFMRPIVLSRHTLRSSIAIFISILIAQTIAYLLSIKMSRTFKEEKEGDLIAKDNAQLIRISLQDFVFAKSCSNYIEIYTSNNTKPYLLRLTLKEFLENNSRKELFRCHRSFVINTNKVTSVSGNSKGYNVHVKDVNEISIPVARDKGKTLNDILQ